MVMKRIMVALFILAGSIAVTSADAKINVSINIGNQPGWGPVGYDHVDYYYFPDNNIYYDIVKAQYIYLSGSRWVYAQQLPSRYGRFDPYSAYKVVINQPDPYRNNSRDIRQYARYKGYRSQAVIRDSREVKYYQSKQHPQHEQWARQNNGRTETRARNDNSRNNSKYDKHSDARDRKNNNGNNRPR